MCRKITDLFIAVLVGCPDWYGISQEDETILRLKLAKRNTEFGMYSKMTPKAVSCSHPTAPDTFEMGFCFWHPTLFSAWAPAQNCMKTACLIDMPSNCLKPQSEALPYSKVALSASNPFVLRKSAKSSSPEQKISKTMTEAMKSCGKRLSNKTNMKL